MKYRKNHNSGPHRRAIDMKIIKYKVKLLMDSMLIASAIVLVMVLVLS
jgi:hypothetical protein